MSAPMLLVSGNATAGAELGSAATYLAVAEQRTVEVDEDAGSSYHQYDTILRRILNVDPIAGNHVQTLIDGPRTYESMFEAIREARHRITLESYTIEPEGPGEALAQMLLEKCAQGVEVYVIYDAAGSFLTNRQYFQRLEAGGVRVCAYNPINPFYHPVSWALHFRNHRKLLVVDERYAFVGGVNISPVYVAGSGLKKKVTHTPWRDTHVRISGPVVPQLQALFWDHWREYGCDVPRPMRAPTARTTAAGPHRVSVAAATAGRGRSPLYRALLVAIEQARNSVYLTTAYFVPPRRLVRTLEAAARRGVDVRLLLPAFTDGWMALSAGRALYGRLLQAGVVIHECHASVLHAKTAVIDGVWSTVGSSNMDWRSFFHNAEINVVVLDHGFGAHMTQLFMRDLGRSRRLNYDDWRRRGIAKRVQEWLSRKIEFLL